MDGSHLFIGKKSNSIGQGFDYLLNLRSNTLPNSEMKECLHMTPCLKQRNNKCDKFHVSISLGILYIHKSLKEYTSNCI